MGIDIESYRAAVGTFYFITHRRNALPKYHMNLRLSAYCARTIFILLFLRTFIKIGAYSVYKIVLLLACMDIEMNPGPNVPGIKSLDIFHLNTTSIRNKIDYIRDLADDFHIICLTETHLDNSIDSGCMDQFRTKK